MWAYIRIFIPTWRFFALRNAIPKLYARPVQGGQLGSSWLPVLPPPRLKWHSLLFNPEINLYHAQCNALEALLSDPEDQEARRIIHRLIRRFLLRTRQVDVPAQYQFKVTVVQLLDWKAIEEDVLAGEGEL